MQSICNDWEFTLNCSDEFLQGKDCPDINSVRLPHTVRELPLQYADSASYQIISGYRKSLHIIKAPGMRYFVRFEGAAHIAEIFANGEKIFEHRSGYTAFTVDITDYISTEGDCLLAVRLDSTENPEIPPFGYVIDYLTFGGLYRPVMLDERPEIHIEDIFAYSPTLDLIHTEIFITASQGDYSGYKCSLSLFDAEGMTVVSEVPAHFDEAGNIATSDGCSKDLPVSSLNGESTKELPVSGLNGESTKERPVSYENGKSTLRLQCAIPVEQAKTWELDAPYLYTLTAVLTSPLGQTDTKSVKIGIRTAEFKTDGFYLNGKKTFLTGLNRHQCYPYIGYAAPASLQKFDAEVLKNELHVNAVRTSHYPQSQAFIDACDELGLLVFTEIPGWQHIGGRQWQEIAIQNTREMVLQYRNHPSIILWGVRINESVDCDVLYIWTNGTAHALDPSRATSGVRYLEKSHLLEDVYSFNDFSYGGGNKTAVAPYKRVCPDPNKPLIISECNGHMFPTKAWDRWDRRTEQALRHAKVLNDAIADGKHAGCFEWCMFDYPTHKDFGSGNMMCYHGVLDYFRNPKQAAYVYASQNEAEPILEISSPFEIGDCNAAQLGVPYVFTNADTVKLYRNEDFVTELAPSAFTALSHGPLAVDDTIGCQLSVKEHMPVGEEKVLKKALLAVARYGLADLPLKDKLRMAWCMIRYGMTIEDGTALYTKYVGSWGGTAVTWRFEAIKNGAVIATRNLTPSSELKLNLEVSSTELHEKDTYDMSLVRVRVTNSCDMTAAYLLAPVYFNITEGKDILTIVGPNTASLQGGMTGTLVKTTGKKGHAKLTVSTDYTEPVTIEFNVT